MALGIPLSTAAAIPVAASVQPASSSGGGVGGAFGRLFENIGNFAADFVGDVAAVGRERALNSIFGPTLNPTGQAGLNDPQTPAQPAPSAQGTILGLDQDTVLIAGGAALGLIALVALLRS